MIFKLSSKKNSFLGGSCNPSAWSALDISLLIPVKVDSNDSTLLDSFSFINCDYDSWWSNRFVISTNLPADPLRSLSDIDNSS